MVCVRLVDIWSISCGSGFCRIGCVVAVKAGATTTRAMIVQVEEINLSGDVAVAILEQPPDAHRSSLHYLPTSLQISGAGTPACDRMIIKDAERF